MQTWLGGSLGLHRFEFSDTMGVDMMGIPLGLGPYMDGENLEWTCEKIGAGCPTKSTMHLDGFLYRMEVWRGTAGSHVISGVQWDGCFLDW